MRPIISILVALAVLFGLGTQSVLAKGAGKPEITMSMAIRTPAGRSQSRSRA
jgi:hypothetical protein